MTTPRMSEALERAAGFLDEYRRNISPFGFLQIPVIEQTARELREMAERKPDAYAVVDRFGDIQEWAFTLERGKYDLTNKEILGRSGPYTLRKIHLGDAVQDSEG